MPSFIRSKILKIQELQKLFVEHDDTFLSDYKSAVDRDSRRVMYITAKVTSNSLDKGFDLTEAALKWALLNGIQPGDYGKQFIPTRLGGVGYISNVFPLNKDIDITKWDADQDLVYNHIKRGNNGHAIVHFGIVYDKKLKDYPSRPFKIYYFYELYQDDDKLVDQIEGFLRNESPKVTNKNFRHGALEMPYVS